MIRCQSSRRYFARCRVQGKLIVQGLKTGRISVAQMRLADLIKEERTKAEDGVNAESGKLTFESAAAILLDRIDGNADLKPRTRAYYRERLDALYRSWPELKNAALRSVDRDDCARWGRRLLKEGASPTAFNHTVSILRQVFAIGIEYGARYSNPGDNVPRVKERLRKLRLPEFDQFLALVEWIDNSGVPHCHESADLVRFLAFGGMRKMEAANVTWQDVDFMRGEIVVRGDPLTGTKNSEIRRVPMIPDMRQLLERLRRERHDESVEAKVMQVVDVRKALGNACKAVGVPRITHHDLRHLFATRCIESGVDIPTVSRWLGHKDGSALAMRVYGHLRDQHSVEMAKRVTFSPPRAENILPMSREAAV